MSKARSEICFDLTYQLPFPFLLFSFFLLESVGKPMRLEVALQTQLNQMHDLVMRLLACDFSTKSLGADYASSLCSFLSFYLSSNP